MAGVAIALKSEHPDLEIIRVSSSIQVVESIVGEVATVRPEAVRDLIDAQTGAAVRQAARQLNGELSSRIQPFQDHPSAVQLPPEHGVSYHSLQEVTDR